MKRPSIFALLVSGLVCFAAAQDPGSPSRAAFAPAALQEPGMKVPSVLLAPVGKVQLKAGGTTSVEMDFRVGEGFHINSNKPRSELLVPTAIKLNPPQPLSVAAVKYPAGQNQTFPFAPKEPLNVYSGDFSITAVLKAPANVAAGRYPVTGELKYQACDRSACYPPKSMPLQFQVTVVK